MLRLFAIAARNVLRNKRRSIISGAAIVVGVAAIVILQGLINAFVTWFVEDAVLANVGAIQVHKAGYHDADRDILTFDLPADPAFEAKLRAVPGVAAVTTRLSFEGMLSNGTVSSMFVATAIDPAREYLVCPKRRTAVAKGSTPIEPGGDGEALVGIQLADSLDGKIRSTLTMLSATRGGAQNALDVTVKGFLPSRFLGESKRMATVPLAFAQGLLNMKGRVTEYVIGVDNLYATAPVVARLRAALGSGYEVEDWRTLVPRARDMEVRIRLVLGLVTSILFVLVATGIINTMLMNVYERVREIGTMLAVGTRRWQVLALFLGEAAILGLAGALGGAALGTAAIARLHRTGFTVTPPGGDPTLYRPEIAPRFVLIAVALAVVGTLVAGLLPAWKASRLRPADALRAN